MTYIQEDIQSYKASRHVAMLHVKSTKPIPPNFYQLAVREVHSQLIHKTALHFPHLFFGLLVCFVPTYHMHKNYIMYIVAM